MRDSRAAAVASPFFCGRAGAREAEGGRGAVFSANPLPTLSTSALSLPFSFHKRSRQAAGREGRSVRLERFEGLSGSSAWHGHEAALGCMRDWEPERKGKE